MCHDAQSHPPILGEPQTTASGTQVALRSSDGAVPAAFAADPATRTGAGVVVLPDNGGLSPFYERVVVALAEQGHPAIAIDYFSRTADPDYRRRGTEFVDMATRMPHLLKLTREGITGDIAAAIEYLEARPGGHDHSIVSLGVCFGGRYAFLTATRRFGFSGAIGLYGFPDVLYGAPGPTQLAGEITGPILALWAGADEGIPPAVVERFDHSLTAAGVDHEFVTYPGAPHAFFETEHPAFADASADAWRRILAFLAARSEAHD